MSINLSEGLQAWIIERQSTKHSPSKQEALATFLGVKNDVEEAIAAGYNLKIIWTYLTDQKLISFRYETFLRYVKRYIKDTPETVTTRQSIKPHRDTSHEINGFAFNAKPNKEDLI